MTGFEAYLLARAYTNKAIEGGGSLKGAACQIKSIEPITGGNRVTFEWEDNQGVVSTDTMDVMNGQDGSDGTDGVGITSITKTSTSGLVDTYTITYTNGTTSTFTVTNGSGADLTAGQYIEIDNDTISVKRDITQTAQQIAYNYTIPSDFTLRVKKYLNGDLVDTTDYQWNSVTEPINLDEIMEISKKAGNYWSVKNLIASTTQAADYSVDLYAMQQATDYTQNFVATIDADKKLIIQSELDAALADKVDKVAGKGLSKNDYTDADKAKVDASKNEFVGTLDEWEALTTAQKKEYDTYQIKNDYSEALMPNYSTTEQKTGQKWIDGRDIYVKTFNAGALPSSGTVTVQNDIVNFGAVINVVTTGISNDGYSFSNDGLVMNYASASSLVFRVTFDATGYNGYVTVYYIKTT